MTKRKTRCGDGRCLYRGGDAPATPRFEVVTEETREGKGLWERCQHCGLVVNRSGVKPEDAEAFYNSTYQEKNSFQKGARIDARKHFEIRLESIRPRAEYLLGHAGRDSVVFELGAGSGELLHLLKPHVRRCVGNELCQEFVDFMNDQLGISASSGNYLDAVPEEKWDLAIAIGTIDHIYDTRLFVEKLFADIKPGGLLYVEVPNDLQALKEFAAFKRYMYQAAHYYSFTFDTLRALLEDIGFAVEEEFSRHDYNLINFLNWYLTGQPQRSIAAAKSSAGALAGDSPFGAELNGILAEADRRFREAITRHKLGESICMLARKPLA